MAVGSPTRLPASLASTVHAPARTAWPSAGPGFGRRHAQRSDRTSQVPAGLAAFAAACATGAVSGGAQRESRSFQYRGGHNPHSSAHKLTRSCKTAPAGEEAKEVKPIWKDVAAFTVPTYALVVTNMILSAVDKAFIGNISSLQLAALGPSTAIFDCSSYLLTFLNTATLVLLGDQPGRKGDKTRSHAFAFSVFGGLVQGALLLLTAVRTVRLLGASAAMVPFSVTYLQIRALGAAVDRAGSVSTQFCLAEKDGVTPMLATLVAAGFNVLGDYLLCPRFGVAGAAVATVAASSLSFAFLADRLRRRSLWPESFQWPKAQDFAPFAAFAGPVFVVLLMKVLLFALMTAGATALGTAPGAAHQVLVSVFFVCGIAFGQPLSWAAQAFLPGTSTPLERRRTKGALLTVAAAAVGLSGATALLMARFCLPWFSQDALVWAQVRGATPAIVGFSMFYVVFLALEGIAIALRRLRVCLAVSVALVLIGGSSIWTLQSAGQLTLTRLWASQLSLLTLACVTVGAVALRGKDDPDQPEGAK